MIKDNSFSNDERTDDVFINCYSAQDITNIFEAAVCDEIADNLNRFSLFSQ